MFFEDAIQRIWSQSTAPLLPSHSLFVLYLVSAFTLSAVSYLWFSRPAAANRPDGVKKGMFGYIFDRDVWWHPSARQDYLFYIANILIYNGIISHFLVSSHVARGVFVDALESVFGPREDVYFEPNVLTAVGYTVVVIVAIDFAIFITHYIQHKIAALWHFHSVHHSAEVLTVITVFRQHPLDLFLTGTVMVFLTQMAFAGFNYLTMTEPSELTVFNVNVILFTFFVLGYNLRHSHIWLSYPVWLSYILISPAQHQTHHSIDARHWDKNFGFILAIWDWMFGTLYVPKGYEDLKFGLSEAEPNPFGSLRELYFKPFSLAWGEIRLVLKLDRGDQGHDGAADASHGKDAVAEEAALKQRAQ